MHCHPCHFADAIVHARLNFNPAFPAMVDAPSEAPRFLQFYKAWSAFGLLSPTRSIVTFRAHLRLMSTWFPQLGTAWHIMERARATPGAVFGCAFSKKTILRERMINNWTGPYTGEAGSYALMFPSSKHAESRFADILIPEHSHPKAQ